MRGEEVEGGIGIGIGTLAFRRVSGVVEPDCCCFVVVLRAERRVSVDAEADGEERNELVVLVELSSEGGGPE